MQFSRADHPTKHLVTLLPVSPGMKLEATVYLEPSTGQFSITSDSCIPTPP